MIRVLKWFRKRYRAENVRAAGVEYEYTGEPYYYWSDPQTGDVWLSPSRFHRVSVPVTDSKAREVTQ